MGFGKWFVVLAAGGIGAGVVMAGMTTGKIKRYPERDGMSGSGYAASRAPSRQEDERLEYDEGAGQGYSLPEDDYASGDYPDGEQSGYGPPRGRMVILDAPGWVERGSGQWREYDDGDADEGDRGDGPAFIAPPRYAPDRGQRTYETGPRYYEPAPRPYAPRQYAPAPSAQQAPARPSAPPVRDAAADSAARAAGAAADVIAAERSGA